jgi:transcriptional regulator with XRE-family HTH domain
MARPRKTLRTPICAAVAELRLSFEETQSEFARRMEVQPVTVARWETVTEPSGEYLERLLALAHSQQHASWFVFRQALWGEEHFTPVRKERLAEIRSAANIQSAGLMLRRLWWAAQPGPETSQAAQKQMAEIRKGLLHLADRISMEGRLELVARTPPDKSHGGEK